MSRITLLCAALLAAVCTTHLQADDLPSPGKAAPVQAPTDPAELKANASYAIGANIGRSIKRDGLQISVEQLIAGLTDALGGKKLRLDEQQAEASLRAFERQRVTVQRQQMAVKAKENAASGVAFLAANKKKEGIVELPSGLQFRVLKKGTGASPKATDTVRTHYRGTLLDGTVFDSSIDRGKPATFPVNRVIPGWTEALQKMRVGDKWQLFVPAKLAYGERGAGDQIGPNATLVFEVELLAIEP